MWMRSRLFSFALAAGALAGCAPLEMVASGISDGTKYVVNRMGTQGEAQQQPASPAASAPAAPAARPDPSEPPVTAAPVTRVGPPEPLR